MYIYLHENKILIKSLNNKFKIKNHNWLKNIFDIKMYNEN